MKHFFARTCRLPLPLSSRVFHLTPTISPKDTFARRLPLVLQHIFHILLTQSARNENGTDLPPEFQESRSFRVCYGVFFPGHPKTLLPPSPSLLPPPFPPCPVFLARPLARFVCRYLARPIQLYRMHTCTKSRHETNRFRIHRTRQPLVVRRHV